MMSYPQPVREVTPGTCVRISTGAPLPPGADAVIQVEDTQLTAEGDDGRTELEITLLSAPTQGQDIRYNTSRHAHTGPGYQV